MKITPKIRAEVIRLRELGKSMPYISKNVGISHGSTHLIISERKRIIEAARKGETVAANVKPLKPVKNESRKVMAPKKTENKRLTINFNGMNIHVDKNTVTDVYLDSKNINIKTK